MSLFNALWGGMDADDVPDFLPHQGYAAMAGATYECYRDQAWSLLANLTTPAEEAHQPDFLDDVFIGEGQSNAGLLKGIQKCALQAKVRCQEEIDIASQEVEYREVG